MITNKDIPKIALNLVVIYVIGGLLLAGVYATTSPIIFKNNIAAKQTALKKIMPEAGAIEKLGDWTIHEHHSEYYAAKVRGATMGYVIESYGKGYSGYIHMLIATDTLLSIIRISVLSHTETPGLGDEIEKAYFKDQFVGKNVDRMKVIKGVTKDDIQAISGATISSRAVTEDAIKNALAFLAKTVRPATPLNAAAYAQPAATDATTKATDAKQGDPTNVKH
jgi:Na+-translocating ferredoxin:NAD+ oxidoreductase subunit G